MFKKISRIFLGLLLVVGTGLSAESTGPRSYLMFGVGTQFDLGGLGGTITKDGLNGTRPQLNSQGEPTGAGVQKAIYAENTLVALNNTSQGLIGVKANGAMVGLNLNVGYEKEGIFGNDNLFWRVNANYTRKISGGYTESTVAGYKWLEQEWDYKAVTIPTYIGIKLMNEKRNTGVYLGAGVHYFRGGWSIAGTVDGDILKNALPGLVGQGGAFLSDAPTNPGVYKENTKFNVAGFGMNWIVGAQTQVTDSGHLFFELETILSAKMGEAGVKSAGGATALSPYPAYPIVIGGQTYRVGYKIEL